MLKIKKLFEVLDPPFVKKGEEKINEPQVEKYHFKFIDLF